MESDEIIMMDDFTLQDAMAALEVRMQIYFFPTVTLTLQIGEPSLDTGFTTKDQAQPPFDPLTPLLPEEVCWILDRAMAYEVIFFELCDIRYTQTFTDGVPFWWRPSPHDLYVTLRSPSPGHRSRYRLKMDAQIFLRPPQTNCPHHHCPPYRSSSAPKMRRFDLERTSKRGHV